MTFSEELQRGNRLMAGRLDHDVIRVRPKVRPCFLLANCCDTQLCYRTIRVPVDHERSVEGEEDKSRLHARIFLLHGKGPLLRSPASSLRVDPATAFRRTFGGLPAGWVNPHHATSNKALIWITQALK
jgi:hypothetical protein